MLPVMVNLDGFILTHTYELLETVDQDKADEYIPYRKFENAMDMENPMNTCITAGPPYNTEFHFDQHCATLRVLDKLKEADEEFNKIFGRSYGGAIETYRADDADTILVTLGSVAGTSHVVIDHLREEDKKVGLVKLRCVRPFPAKELAETLKNAKAVAVLEKDISHGYEGAVFSDINSGMKQYKVEVPTYNYIGGLGGRSISKEDIENIFADIENGVANSCEPKFIALKEEICNA
jgi:pyruvate ferredoxin oxidoreductase alpha subunit